MSDFVARCAAGPVVLDGGLATELEDRGFALDDPLWSARFLLDGQDAIQAAHRAFTRAGADVLLSASYQASLPGLRARGLSRSEAEAALRGSVALVQAVADEVQGRPAPLVAASIGPYGAYRADGSEFHGDYRVPDTTLRDFHRDRLAVLGTAGADLLACETIPCAAEATVLGELLAENPAWTAWLSFTCHNGKELRHGEPIAEVVRPLDAVDAIVAFGVNCTAPEYVADLLAALRRVTAKPIVLYPNAGEAWSAEGWRDTDTSVRSRHDRFAELGRRWLDAGAHAVGGCCRVGARHIATLARSLGRNVSADG